MDTAITGVLKVNAVLLVLGFSVLAYLASNVSEWGYAGGFAWGAAASAFGFTLLWALTYYQMAEVLGKRERKEFTTQNIIGTGVALVAVLTNVCFMSVAITAASKLAWDPAAGFAWGGLAATALTSIIWAVSDVNFVRQQVDRNRR